MIFFLWKDNDNLWFYKELALFSLFLYLFEDNCGNYLNEP